MLFPCQAFFEDCEEPLPQKNSTPQKGSTQTTEKRKRGRPLKVSEIKDFIVHLPLPPQLFWIRLFGVWPIRPNPKGGRNKNRMAEYF